MPNLDEYLAIDEDENEEIRPGAKGMNRITNEMYADINNPEVATDEYFVDRTILTTTNAIVHRINDTVTGHLSGQAKEYVSLDSVEDDGDGSFLEPEFSLDALQWNSTT
ncbi:hypothetical protein PI124_g13104 [Phytophthora idaei]|nr:hypothetical protein PI125_g12667 [Phytophthora idaei]KAG3150184.1 hypothetical protein PI126_g11630 [Phytophthora idaei]KAG3242053.1 hypothetical protein PI124_g13104 [Phytophthora idaei]